MLRGAPIPGLAWWEVISTSEGDTELTSGDIMDPLSSIVAVGVRILSFPLMCPPNPPTCISHILAVGNPSFAIEFRKYVFI